MRTLPLDTHITHSHECWTVYSFYRPKLILIKTVMLFSGDSTANLLWTLKKKIILIMCNCPHVVNVCICIIIHISGFINAPVNIPEHTLTAVIVHKPTLGSNEHSSCLPSVTGPVLSVLLSGGRPVRLHPKLQWLLHWAGWKQYGCRVFAAPQWDHCRLWCSKNPSFSLELSCTDTDIDKCPHWPFVVIFKRSETIGKGQSGAYTDCTHYLNQVVYSIYAVHTVYSGSVVWYEVHWIR